jgi:anthranilate synthase component 1
MIAFEEFKQLANTQRVVPIEETMLADQHTPVSIYGSLRSSASPSFLLESAEPDERIGRFSFVGTDPLMLIKARGDLIEIESEGRKEVRQGKMLDLLEEYSRIYRCPSSPDQKGFAGGFLGYFGYDRVKEIENITLRQPFSEDAPDSIFGLFRSVVKFDHRQQRITITCNVLIDATRTLEEQYEQGKHDLVHLVVKLDAQTKAENTFVCDPESLQFDTDKEAFCASVRRAKQYIREGDIFQVVLSRRMRVPFSGDPFPVYRALRIINPSPYLFYLDFGDVQLIGSSPEALVRVQQRVVTVMPIAGTHKRGATEEEDQRLGKKLLADEKEAAEHVMLVDLGRNDIGRVSEYGSVHVPVFRHLKRFSHVMHLVSEVQGILKPEAGSVSALRACFPAGTVSGAPKIRAMEIINELEPARRGIYAGAVGYLGFDGTLDTCIAIRTIVAANGRVSIQAGAGIVADSVEEHEFLEIENKARAMLEALTVASDDLLNIHRSNGMGGKP